MEDLEFRKQWNLTRFLAPISRCAKNDRKIRFTPTKVNVRHVSLWKFRELFRERNWSNSIDQSNLIHCPVLVMFRSKSNRLILLVDLSLTDENVHPFPLRKIRILCVLFCKHLPISSKFLLNEVETFWQKIEFYSIFEAILRFDEFFWDIRNSIQKPRK